jgi:hypothetical protein
LLEYRLHNPFSILTNIVLLKQPVKQGNAIYAEIPNNLVAEKSPRIQMNKVYDIQRFKVLPVRSLYILVQVDFMIQSTIYTETQVVTNPPATFPSYMYKLTSFDQIPGVAGKTEYFVGDYKVFISCLHIIYVCAWFPSQDTQ